MALRCPFSRRDAHDGWIQPAPNPHPTLNDIIHAAVFVIPITKLLGGEEVTRMANLQRVKSFFTAGAGSSNEPFVIITYCDQVPVVAADLTKLYTAVRS